jgi:hypothetical protein
MYSAFMLYQAQKCAVRCTPPKNREPNRGCSKRAFGNACPGYLIYQRIEN